jgi:hypothetical protein
MVGTVDPALRISGAELFKDRTMERELSLEGLLGRSGETFRSLKERNEVAGVSWQMPQIYL